MVSDLSVAVTAHCYLPKSREKRSEIGINICKVFIFSCFEERREDCGEETKSFVLEEKEEFRGEDRA
jgi:hypothetical protein